MSDISNEFNEILEGILERKTYFSESNLLQQVLLNVVGKHIQVLLRKRKQLIYTNDYGFLVKDDWFRELEGFLKSVYLKEVDYESIDALLSPVKKLFFHYIKEDEAIQRMKEEGLYSFSFDAYPDEYHLTVNSRWWLPKEDKDREFPEKLEIFEKGYILKDFSDLVIAADLAVEDYLNGIEGKKNYLFTIENFDNAVGSDTSIDFIKNGYEYEVYCAELLDSLGWQVEIKKKSGDQGVDLIGSRLGYRVVFQCKFYSSPVGNQAVQEAIAGKVFEQADYGVVA